MAITSVEVVCERELEKVYAKTISRPSCCGISVPNEDSPSEGNSSGAGASGPQPRPEGFSERRRRPRPCAQLGVYDGTHPAMSRSPMGRLGGGRDVLTRCVGPLTEEGRRRLQIGWQSSLNRTETQCGSPACFGTWGGKYERQLDSGLAVPSCYRQSNRLRLNPSRGPKQKSRRLSDQ